MAVLGQFWQGEAGKVRHGVVRQGVACWGKAGQARRVGVRRVGVRSGKARFGRRGMMGRVWARYGWAGQVAVWISKRGRNTNGLPMEI